MNDDRFENVLAEHLAAYQEKLERAGPEPGGSVQSAGGEQVPADLEQDFESQKRCLDLLHSLRPPRQLETDLEVKRGPTESRANGRFQILNELGSGGFGIVWRARDPATGRIVALKVPRPEVLASAELRKRFEQEAEAAARLDHPNIVPILEAGTDGIVPYIASTYYEGPTLAAWLRDHEGQVTPRQAAQIMLALAKALAHAHERGVLHRDVKPSNVLLAPVAEGDARELPFEPKLMDFGLAKLGERDQELTRTGAMLGTLKYMAPEQAAGRAKEITAATDVYGLGVVLYELLTGAPPFSGDSDWLTLRQVLEDEPRSISSVRRDVPRDLAVIVQKCLSKAPAQRYRSARELAEDFERFLAGRSIIARPIPPAERLVKWCRRNPAWATLAAVVTFAIASGIAFLSYSNVRISALLASEQTARQQLASSLESEKATREQLAMRLYASDLRRADEALDRSNVQVARDILEPYALQKGGKDYREFAWRYLWSRIPQQRPFVEQQKAAIYSLGLSPDQKWLATAGADGHVRVWETATKREVCALPCGRTEINEVTFSPDGKLLAAACETARICVWEAGTWKQRHDLSIGGVITVDAYGGADRFHAVSVQTNGMIVAAGVGFREDGDDAMLYRIKPNGQPDSSFGSAGDVRCLLTPGRDGATAMVVEQEGRIVVAGYQDNDNFAVQRFEPNGSIDLQFGDGGTTVVDLGAPDDLPGAITRTADQKYLLAGSTRQNGYYDVALVCLTSDGRLDPSFGKDGIQITQGSQFHDKATAIAVQPDGKIVAAGSRTTSDGDSGPADIFVLRYHPNGTLDEHFGDQGCAVLASSDVDDQAHSLGLQGDGKIIVTGQTIVDGSARMLAARFSSDGTLDSSFGRHGAVIVGVELANSVARAVAVQPDDKILLVGGVGPSEQRSFALVRLNGDGSFDESFGRAGHVTKRVGNGSELHSVALSKDSRIVVAGVALCGGIEHAAENFAVARLFPDGRFDQSFTTNGAQGVVFSPDSRRLISYSHQCVRIWEMESGEVVQETYCPREALVDIDLSSDGKQLLTASDTRFWGWNVEDCRVPNAEQRYKQGIGALASLGSPGEVFFSLRSGPLLVWDLGKSEESAVIKHRKRGRARNLKVSNDGKLAAAVFDNSALVYRTADWMEVANIVTHSRIYDVVFLAGAQSILTSGGDGTVLEWQLARNGEPARGLGNTARLVHSVAHPVVEVAFSKDDQLVACGHREGSVYVRHCPGGEVVYSDIGEGVEVIGLAFSRDDQLIVGYASGKIDAINLNDATVTTAFKRGHPIGHLRLSPDGNQLAITLDEVRTVEVRAWPSCDLVCKYDHGDELVDLKFSPNGKLLVLGGSAHLEAFDARTGKQLGSEIEAGQAYESVQMLRDEKRMVVAEMSEGLAVREIPSCRQLVRVPCDADVRRVAVTSDERNVAAVDSYGSIQVWDTKTWELVVNIETELGGDVNCLCFSKDGRKLFATSHGDLYMWEAP